MTHVHREGVLASAFARVRQGLETDLPGLASVRDATKALREALERLPEACAGEDAGPVALAGDMVRAAVLGTLGAVRGSDPPASNHREEPRRGGRRGGLIDKIRPGDNHRDREPDRRPEEPPRLPSEPAVHTPTLLDQLTAAFEAADRVLAAAEPPPPERVVLGWAEDTQLLDVFHELLTADAERDGELALRHIAHLKSTLRLQHGIEAVEYDEGTENAFTYMQHTDPADRRILTVRPALVASGRLLRRGEVRGPKRPELTPNATPEQETRDDG